MTTLLGRFSVPGWRGRAVLAFLVGGLSMLSMPPFLYWTVLFVTMPVLVLLLDEAALQDRGRLRAAVFIGWCFGFGYFLAGFYWVYHAFLVESNMYGWLIPVVVPLLPALLAVFYALACMIAVYFWSAGAARIIALALAFAVMEWIRGHAFTGFPWHSFGYSLTSSPALMQSASLFGIYGLAFIAVVLFASPVLLLRDDMALPQEYRRFCSSHEGRFLMAVMGLFTVLLLWGSMRLMGGTEFHNTVSLRIVQPNIVQKDKWNKDKEAGIKEKYLSLTRQAVAQDKGRNFDQKTLVVWPESAMPFLLLRNRAFLLKMAEILPPNSFWLTGNVRLEQGKPGTGRRFYNSLLMFDDKAEGLKVFDKKHLIPFGEYMPLKPLFNLIGFQQLANSHGAFTVGSRPRFLATKGVPSFVPLLCYEVIFPGEVIEGKRPEWLLNITNDAWYGLSDGPYQHMHYAKVRSVEQGLPMVRAANTGISAIIDSYGRVVRKLPLGQRGVVDGLLPKKISATLYARYGGGMFVFVLIIGLFIYKTTRR